MSRDLLKAYAATPGALDGTEEERWERAVEALGLELVDCPRCHGDGCITCDDEGFVFTTRERMQ